MNTSLAYGTNIPHTAIVPVKQDPYSGYFLTNYNTARNVYNDTDPRFGGSKSKSRKSRKTRKARKTIKKRKN